VRSRCRLDLGDRMGAGDRAWWGPRVVDGGRADRGPYRDENESSIGWIEERDWWFRGLFAGPSDLAEDDVYGSSFTASTRWRRSAERGTARCAREHVPTGGVRLTTQWLPRTRSSCVLAALRGPTSAQRAETFRRLAGAFGEMARRPPREAKVPSESLALSTLAPEGDIPGAGTSAPRYVHRHLAARRAAGARRCGHLGSHVRRMHHPTAR